MSDPTVAVVPRRNRDEVSPSAPLDPYVTMLVRWLATQEQGVNPNALAKLAAVALGWPVPFAEAVATATRARKLLTLMQVTTRGGYRTTLSSRGKRWLDQTEDGVS